MNQQDYQPNSGYTPPAAIKNAAYYRARARYILKGFYGLAILAALLATLLGGAAIASSGFGVSFNVPFDDSFESIMQQVSNFSQILQTEGLSAIFAAYPWLSLVLGVSSALVLFSLLFSLFVGAPITLGYQRFNLNLVDGKDRELNVLFRYFKHGYGKSIGLRVLYSLLSFAASVPMLLGCGFVVFALLQTNPAAPDHSAYILLLTLAVLVWFVLAIVSCILQILVQYRYVFSFMILAEYPEIGAVDALRNSANLMKGNKWRFFCLQFSFIGWYLLFALVTCCTCGLGALTIFLLTPYEQAAYAAFYDDIANRRAAKEAEFPSLDPNDYNSNQTN